VDRTSSDAANGLSTKVVATPICIPNDQAVTSYGGSGGDCGVRRTSGYVWASSMSFAYRPNTCAKRITNVPAA
jgi:hypothetical protein